MDRVPLRVRIGVTGHRVIRDEGAITRRVDEVLLTLRGRVAERPTTSILLEVVSALGEGADCIVAERVLARTSSTLEVPLPFRREEYEQHFTSDEARRRFASLVKQASNVWVVGADDRADSYRQAGEYVVESCDLLIAIWDGEPSRGSGGTKDILELARARRMPVIVIRTQPPHTVTTERMPAFQGMLRAFDRYNSTNVSRATDDMTRWLPSSLLSDEEGGALDKCLHWIAPHYWRADTIASRNRTWFTGVTRLMLLMSALAVLAIAMGVSGESSAPAAQRMEQAFAYLEAGLMVLALALWVRQKRLRVTWIESRFLAERLRSATMLVYSGLQNIPQPTPVGEYRGGARQWITRVYREVWPTRPFINQADRDVERVKDTLRWAWIEPQVAYYQRRHRYHERARVGTLVVGGILFASTILAAVLHASDPERPLARTFVILSIALPAFAVAIAASASLEQHARNAERFEHMAQRLQERRDRLQREVDLARVQHLALQVEAELRTERDEWSDVMRFQEADIPV